MARHSHWHQIRQKKGIADVKRGKIFTEHGKLITLAAKKGGDPETNPSLRLAIENARADNMPKENIDRAIKKGTGEDKSAAELVEIVYEGFGPGGVAMMISVITDSKNRTAQVVRHALSVHGGNLGESGSTAWMFELKGLIKVKGSGNREEDELKIIDAGAEDLVELDTGKSAADEREKAEFLVSVPQNSLAAMREKLKAAGFDVVSADLEFVPKTLLKISDKETAQKIIELLETLENEDDISKIATNVELAEGF